MIRRRLRAAIHAVLQEELPTLRQSLGLEGPGGISLWTRLDAVQGEGIRARQMLRYLTLAAMHRGEADLAWAERSIFSQNGEDGVLFEIFRRIGEDAANFLEIGVHSQEGNCLALAEVLGWSGTFVDGSPDRTRELGRKYRGLDRVRVRNEFVTRENITGLVGDESHEGRLDLLSIDVDGNDYWIWKALDNNAPRVVVIEYNAMLPAGSRLVQPYGDQGWDGSEFFGASAGAMVELAHDKGYRLVHADLAGSNLFFVRREHVGAAFLEEERVLARAANYLLAAMLPAPSARIDWIDLEASPDSSG